MSDPIKVGDLVMQIRDCCGKCRTTGMVGTVKHVHDTTTRCRYCSSYFHCIHVSCGKPKGGVPLSWVKKIDPPQVLDDVKQDEEITA